MTLVLNNEEVEKVLTMEACLEVLEEASRNLGRGVGGATEMTCIIERLYQ
jgi:arginine deiminase